MAVNCHSTFSDFLAALKDEELRSNVSYVISSATKSFGKEGT